MESETKSNRTKHPEHSDPRGVISSPAYLGGWRCKHVTQNTVFSQQSVVTFFESTPRITRLSRVLGMNYIQPEDDTYESDEWFESCEDYYDDEGLVHNEFTTRSPRSFYNSPLRCIADLKESDAERKGRLLQEEKQNKDKAEKKRIKKKRQKERKQREKAEMEKVTVKDGEDDTREPGALSTDQSDRDTGRSPEKKESNGSPCEFSAVEDSHDEAEELDLSSTFVSKAAEMVKRKLDLKPKSEQREKKLPNKCPKPKDDTKQEVSEEQINSTLEENIKRSNELALIGNQYANMGDFKMAVKFFTDAVKYNPTEFKLFGNRSFCYEKLQDYERALADAELCLSISPRWVKGLFRKGRALAGLKRYVEASQAFREVLKLDMKCAEAAQELMRVQIIQLMEYGYTREQSTNALIIHGTFSEALEALSQLNQQPKVSTGVLLRPQVINATGTSPVLSANPGLPPPHTQGVSEEPRPSYPPKRQPSPIPPAVKTNDSESNRPQPKELFPVWVGNVASPITEFTITDLFQSVGKIHSVKVLMKRRCAFVNFTKPEDCNKAIRRFHGSMLNGIKLVVRYPDRFPEGLGISRSALKAPSLYEEHVGSTGEIQFRHRSNGPDVQA